MFGKCSGEWLADDGSAIYLNKRPLLSCADMEAVTQTCTALTRMADLGFVVNREKSGLTLRKKSPFWDSLGIS